VVSLELPPTSFTSRHSRRVISSPANSRWRPLRTNSSTKVVTMITVSNRWNPACGTPENGMKKRIPKAQRVIGISMRKSVVMASDRCARASSHAGSSSEGAHSLDKTVYPRSARTQAASITIYSSTACQKGVKICSKTGSSPM